MIISVPAKEPLYLRSEACRTRTIMDHKKKNPNHDKAEISKQVTTIEYTEGGGKKKDIKLSVF